jgi:ribose transport system permease protein
MTSTSASQENINSPMSKFRRISKNPNFGVFMILFVLCVLLSTASDKFFTQQNLFSVMRAFSYIAIIAIGQCLVIISGGVDLSVGSVYGFSGLMTAFLMKKAGFAIPFAIAGGLTVGCALGMANGLLITKVRIPPFIATLGMLSVTRGLSYALTTGYPIRTGKIFNMIGQGYLWIIPLPVVYMVVLAIIFTIFLNRTVTGRRIRAIGGNEEAAKVSGINVSNVKVVVYSLCGLLSAVAGIATTARLGVAQSTSGMGYELDAIAAVIIGGASLSGGKGTILGAVLGAAIMGVLKNGLILLNVSAYWQQTVLGLVVILAIAADQFRKRY